MEGNEILKDIARVQSEDNLLCQLAEEASELSQAALKVRRTRFDPSGTSMTEGEAMNNLYEEFGDVLNSMYGYLYKAENQQRTKVKDAEDIIDIERGLKILRWAKRTGIEVEK